MPDETLSFEHPLNFSSEAYHLGKNKDKKKEGEAEEVEVEIIPDKEADLPDIRTDAAKQEDKKEDEPKKEEEEDDAAFLEKLPENSRFGIQKRINKEVWRRHEEARGRANAEARAVALEAELAQYKQRVDHSDNSALTSREEQIKSARAAVQREYMAAAEENNAQAMFEATQKLAQLAADDKEVEIYKRNRAAQQPRQEQQQQQQPQRQQPADPLAVEWAGSNPWFGRDRVMTATAFAIDQELKEGGIPPATPQFYRELDKRLREELPHKFGETRPVRKLVTQPVAGASRAPAKSGARPQLTEREFEVARRLGVPPAEYARFKQG